MATELMARVNVTLGNAMLGTEEREQVEEFFNRASLVALQGLIAAVDTHRLAGAKDAANEALAYAWELTRQRFSL